MWVLLLVVRKLRMYWSWASVETQGKGTGCLDFLLITQVAIYVASYVRVSDPESSIAKIRIAIFIKLASSVQKGR